MQRQTLVVNMSRPVTSLKGIFIKRLAGTCIKLREINDEYNILFRKSKIKRLLEKYMHNTVTQM